MSASQDIKDSKQQPETTVVDSVESLSEGPDDRKHFVYNEARKDRLSKTKRLADILTIVCAGFALISDGYQNNVMSMLNTVFARQYPKNYTADLKTSVSNASLVGTIFGQIAIGFASDLINRKQSIIIATCFLIVGTIMCAASHGKTIDGMFWMLIISRGVTGFGIGAEYPSSSVSASEAANETVKRRGGVFCLVTNLPLSLGGPFALIIFLIVYKITGNKESLWRTLFAIGAFWPLSVFYFRMKMATSQLFKKSAIRSQVPYWLALKYYWPRLIGTCGCWFLYDFVTFPNGIFSGTIIANVLKGPEKTDLNRIAEWNLLLAVMSLPGVFIGAYFVDRIGRKWTMLIGFSGYLVFGLIIGCSFDKIKNILPLFIIFWGIFNSFGNGGPGNMLGLTSSESFATPIRGTFYGLSAALGKTGSVVGTKTFTPIQAHLGEGWTFIIAAICGLVGVLCCYFFIPHLREDDLMAEDIRFKNYLIDNGWKGTFGVEEGAEEVVLTVSSDPEEFK